MVFFTGKIIPLLFVSIIPVFNEPTRSRSRMKPILNVNESQRIINEGETIELECTGDEGVVFYYPKNNPQTSVTQPMRRSLQRKNDIKYHIKFSLNLTTFQDTGYYGCAYNGSEFKENIYKSSKASWIYIYVRSNESLFVQVQNTDISGYKQHDIVIPCRPTSPNYNVTLSYIVFHPNTKKIVEKEVQLNDDVIFDPKFGFMLKNIDKKKAGNYQCTFIDEGPRPFQTWTFNLLVYDPPRVDIKHASTLAIESHSFSLECRIRGLSTYPGPQLRWIVANGDIHENSTSSNDRITSNLLVSEERSDFIVLTSFLTIKKLALSDEGNYTCALLSNGYLFNSHTHLKVYDSNTEFIKLTSLNTTNTVEVGSGHSLTFAAKIDVHPDIGDIKVDWLRSGRKKIVTNEEYDIIDGVRNFTRLIIKNVKEMNEDANQYSVQVSSSANISAVLDFGLQVWTPPIVNFDITPSHYEPSSEVKLACYSKKPPATNITWYFQKRTAYELDKEPEPFQHAKVEQNETFIVSKISLIMDSTGNITCKVCNVVKCEKKNKSVTVAGELLKIEKIPQVITEGNNITLACTGSVIDYNQIAWYNRDHDKIKENDRIKFSVQNFSTYRRSIMSIDAISKADEKSYWCGAMTAKQLTLFKEVEISVKESPPGVVFQSNMNGSEVSYNVEIAAQMTINLTCYVKGLQKPNISWSKDGQYINRENRTYQFSDEKQVLRITHPDKTCTGLYRCSLNGSDEASLKIVIAEEPEWPVITGIVAGCIVLGIVSVVLYRKMKHQEKCKIPEPVTVGRYTFFNYELVTKDPTQLERLISEREFPRHKLILGKRLGHGQFGQVVQGLAQGITAPNTVTEVAVKMARVVGGPIATMALSSEFRILCHIGKHLNVLNLLGVVRDVHKGLLVVVEYCLHGSFDQYLVKCRDSFFSPLDAKEKKISESMEAMLRNMSDIQGRRTRRNYALSYLSPSATASRGNKRSGAARTVIIDPNCPPNLHRDYDTEIILTEDLLIWAYQVALGMQYVSSKKVIHGDLAARNILLCDNNVVKICDFGLAKKLYHTNYYHTEDDTPLPVKWMAIESLRENIFTVKSDVWSFGVVLWEIFTLADSPYPGFIKPQEIYDQLCAGYRMPKPQYMTNDVYSIVRQCWAHEPTSRPTFSQLVEQIANMLPGHVARHFVERNKP